MQVNIGKKESKIISWEILCTLNSIRYYPRTSFKTNVTLKNFEDYKIGEFDLREGQLSVSEFKTIMRLLDICRKIELKDANGVDSVSEDKK